MTSDKRKWPSYPSIRDTTHRPSTGVDRPPVHAGRLRLSLPQHFLYTVVRQFCSFTTFLLRWTTYCKLILRRPITHSSYTSTLVSSHAVTEQPNPPSRRESSTGRKMWGRKLRDLQIQGRVFFGRGASSAFLVCSNPMAMRQNDKADVCRGRQAGFFRFVLGQLLNASGTTEAATQKPCKAVKTCRRKQIVATQRVPLSIQWPSRGLRNRGKILAKGLSTFSTQHFSTQPSCLIYLCISLRHLGSSSSHPPHSSTSHYAFLSERCRRQRCQA